jgi:hypothetical protein
MSDYTVIPAAPGTELLEGLIDHEEGSKPSFRRRMVVAWRVSKSERFGLEAVIVGGPNVVVDDCSGDVMDSGDFSSITVVRDGEGWGTFDGDMVLGSDLRQKMTVALRDSRDRHLAEVRRREVVGDD